jgi:hypothetical protein
LTGVLITTLVGDSSDSGHMLNNLAGLSNVVDNDAKIKVGYGRVNKEMKKGNF